MAIGIEESVKQIAGVPVMSEVERKACCTNGGVRTGRLWSYEFVGADYASDENIVRRALQEGAKGRIYGISHEELGVVAVAFYHPDYPVLGPNEDLLGGTNATRRNW